MKFHVYRPPRDVSPHEFQPDVHAQLLTMRPSGLTVVGILRLSEPEWDALAGGQAQIEVLHAPPI